MTASSAVATATNVRAITDDDAILQNDKLWQVVSSGDLKGLSAAEKSAYYLYRCRVEGLNPASQPFQYLIFQGREILYATRSAADQLRKLHGISIVSVECVEDGEYITYEVRVRAPDGREDFELGSVFVGPAKGDQRSNARMKALTKAKRRATYSICGTGALDETEVADIPTTHVEGDTLYGTLTTEHPTYRSVARVDVIEAKVRGIPVDADHYDSETGEILGGQQALPADIPENGSDMMSTHQRGEIMFLAGKLGWTDGEGGDVDLFKVNAFAGEQTGISNIDNLSAQRASIVITAMREKFPKGRRSS